MSLTGVVRAEFLRARSQDYVRAAKALGVDDGRIMLRHMLPNAMIAVLTFLPFSLSQSITLLASLDFLGFGMPPGAPSLGELVGEARAKSAGAVAGVDRVRGAGRGADPADLYRRGGAGCFRRPTVPGARALSLLEVEGLTLVAGGRRPVDALSFGVAAGETLAIVGESGAGKTLAALSVLNLLPPGVARQAGRITLDGMDVPAARPEVLRRLRGGVAGMIFQEPLLSLNPLQRVGRQVGEAMILHQGSVRGPILRDNVLALLREVGLAGCGAADRRVAASPVGRSAAAGDDRGRAGRATQNC